MENSSNLISILASVALTTIGTFIVQRVAIRWRQGDAVTLMETRAKIGLYEQYDKLLKSMQVELTRIVAELDDVKAREEKCKKEVNILNNKINELEYTNERLKEQIEDLRRLKNQ
jgi:peptidoglycan hydrolase CwlO-like protein